jgi:hypothetical protein
VAARGAVGPALLDEVLDAHGGLERWRSASEVRAHVRTGGLLVRTRFPGNRMSDYELRVTVDEPRSEFAPFPDAGKRTVFEAGGVRLEDQRGDLLASRSDPRSAFGGLGGLRRNFRWDPLDATYFAGYAMWNYLTTPYLLTREGVNAREGEPLTEGDETWRRLEVDFPLGVPTHSAHQTFFVDAAGLIRRHDYTAEVIGRWARAAHHWLEHRRFDGLVFPTRRRVVPRGPGDLVLPGPALVQIELDQIVVT